MKVKVLLLFLVIVIPASLAFQWTSSSQIPDGSSFRACVGERASFPWSFSLSTGERVIGVEWYRTTGQGQVLVAVLVAGHFFAAVGQNVTFVPGAGLQVVNVSLAEFGTYRVSVNYNSNGSLLSSQQTAFLTMEDAPVLAESQLVVKVCPEPVLDDVTGRLHVQLSCGHFLSLGSRPVSVVWKTPSDHTVASTEYINGTFRLNLPHPTQVGGYYCHLKDPSVASRCIPNVSRLTRGAYIHVDEVQIRLTLLEGGLRGFQAKEEMLDREMDRQMDLVSELQSRERNLSAAFGYLAETTRLLLSLSKILTSENEKLTSDNDGLKSQMKSMTEETAMLSSRLTASASDLSRQLLELKSRRDVATKRISFFANLQYKVLSEGEIMTSTDVVTNEGGAYDGTTGTFTAPINGTYFFLVNIIASIFSRREKNAQVTMNVDGMVKAMAMSSFDDMYITGSCHGLFRLTQSQRVWVQNSFEDTKYLGESTFSGALLHPDLP